MSLATPRYRREDHGVGVAHIGIGAFFRAHQAVYTDDALAAEGGDWRIAAIAPRSADVAHALTAQDGLYTVLSRGPDGTAARRVGSIARTIAAREDLAGTLATLADPAVRIITLTVTEKAYGIAHDASGARLDTEHADVAHDLSAPGTPRGIVGLLVEALRRRRQAGAPVAIVSCDNLSENGALLHAGVRDFAARTDPALAEWITEVVTFPSTMVDRITPAPTDETRTEAARLTGREDAAAVECEPFSQWVIEDRFPAGRPAWEAGGALIVPDVAPYETMKLRMLNGAHSLIAYTGVVAGYPYVRGAMADAPLAALVARHMDAAARTLDPVPAVDLSTYAADLRTRFQNPAIAHATAQIASDGTQKLPQRILAPAAETLDAGGDAGPFAFALAAWMRYTTGRTDAGETYPLNDPREAAITAALGGANDAASITGALLSLDIIPPRLATDAPFREAVTARLAEMLERGMAAAITAEASG